MRNLFASFHSYSIKTSNATRESATQGHRRQLFLIVNTQLRSGPHGFSLAPAWILALLRFCLLHICTHGIFRLSWGIIWFGAAGWTFGGRGGRGGGAEGLRPSPHWPRQWPRRHWRARHHCLQAPRAQADGSTEERRLELLSLGHRAWVCPAAFAKEAPNQGREQGASRPSGIGNYASRTAEPILSLPTLLIGPVIKPKHKTWLLHTVTTSNYAPLLHLDLGSKQLVPNLRMMKRFKVHAWLFQCVQWLILCKSSCSLVVLAYYLIFFMAWMYIVRQFATTVFQSIPCNRPWTSNLLQIHGYCMLHSPKRLRLPAHVYLHPSPRTIAIALTGAAAGPLEPML